LPRRAPCPSSWWSTSLCLPAMAPGTSSLRRTCRRCRTAGRAVSGLSVSRPEHPEANAETHVANIPQDSFRIGMCASPLDPASEHTNGPVGVGLSKTVRISCGSVSTVQASTRVGPRTGIGERPAKLYSFSWIPTGLWYPGRRVRRRKPRKHLVRGD
jgi:hypothetical protein